MQSYEFYTLMYMYNMPTRDSQTVCCKMRMATVSCMFREVNLVGPRGSSWVLVGPRGSWASRVYEWKKLEPRIINNAILFLDHARV